MLCVDHLSNSEREITLGDMTLYLGAVRMSQGSFQGLLDNIARLYENGLFMENLFSFLSIRPRERITIDSSTPESVPRSGIEFSGVSYRYPSSSDYAVSDFSLSIRPGEKIAVVGENGSGKTTLIKLLTRLYEPVSGHITIDGQDLQRMDAGEIHRRIGVIFQDYVRYQLTLRENIGFGSIENLEDTDRVLSALKNSGSEDLLTSLPDGLESMLGHQFLKGRELSVGQWQKIALGRAFMRLSDILILDEPTSSMDANREYEIFRRFQALTEGKTVILISHRFSTVRMADRIGVMQKGCLVELGSHEELIEKDGVYRKMFELQAQGYR